MKKEVDLFKLIQSEDWEALTAFLHQKQKDIKNEPMLQYAARTFVSELLNKTSIYSATKKGIDANLETLYTIHQGKYYTLSEEDFKTLVCRIVLWKKDDLKYAVKYAQMFPEESICAEVIKKYEKLTPKQLVHTQSERIKVSQRTNIADVDYRINLFKSPQEIEFFKALIDAFPNYHIYPNVAVSCLLNWDKLENELTKKEKDYFFKAIVDFVVFDQADGYHPKYFFEIDSSYHDKADVIKKDELKDSIFSKAGVTLKRIRKQDTDIGTSEFIKLIRELTT